MIWTLIYSFLGATEPTSVCDVRDGALPVGSQVQLEGRFVSDFTHFTGIGDPGLNCVVAWRLSEEAANSAYGLRLHEVTRGADRLPSTSEIDFRVGVRGHLERLEPNSRTPNGANLIVVDELTSFSIDGVPQ